MTRWLKRAGVMMAAGCVAMTGGVVWAQVAEAATGHAPVAEQRFEVATIKPSDPSSRNQMLNFNGESMETQGETVKDLIKFAYGLNMSGEQQVVGAPKWVNEQRWDINAKEDAETVAAIGKMQQQARREQFQMMVQSFLTERFHLKVHRETRELPVYALVVAKGGSKLTPAPPRPIGPDGQPHGNMGIRGNGKGEFMGMNATTGILANTLGYQAEIGGKTVIDRTGMAGEYNFELKWTPDMLAASGESNGPSLFTALQEELGLKLEATKALVEVVVIDGVEEPTAN